MSKVPQFSKKIGINTDRLKVNKAAPALMAGNTVVVKSSEKAPLTVSRGMRISLCSSPQIAHCINYGFFSLQRLQLSSRKLDSHLV